MGGPRSYLVLHLVRVELQRVDVFFRIGLADFHVQVRTERVAFISGQGKYLALLQRKLVGTEGQVHRKGFVLVLIGLHHLLHLVHELVQMPVHRSVSVGVGNVHRLSVSSGSHRNTADVPVGNASYGFPHHPLRLEVHPAVEVVGTQFSEIPAQQQGKIEGRDKGIFRLFLSRKSYRSAHQDSAKPASYVVFLSPNSFHSTNLQINSQIPTKSCYKTCESGQKKARVGNLLF